MRDYSRFSADFALPSYSATGIIIEHEAPEAAAEATGGQATGGEATGGESTPAAVAERAIRLIPRLLARAAAESSESVGEPVRSLGGGYFFIEGYHKAIAAAIGFYLVAKFCRLALYFIYGMLLPKFRKAQL